MLLETEASPTWFRIAVFHVSNQHKSKIYIENAQKCDLCDETEGKWTTIKKRFGLRRTDASHAYCISLTRRSRSARRQWPWWDFYRNHGY